MHDLVLGFVVLLACSLGGLLARVVVQRQLRRRALVECAIRFAGAADGGRSWRHGAARPHPGRLEFLPYGASGWRTFQGRPFEFEVLDAQIQEGRRPPLRHSWSVGFSSRIAVLSTPEGLLELAAPPGRLRALCQDLRPR